MNNTVFSFNCPFELSTGQYGHTIKQYSLSGKLLTVLGTPGKAGSNLSPLQFDQPADIFVKTNGDVYIVDGDGGLNNRLLMLTKGTVIITCLYYTFHCYMPA